MKKEKVTFFETPKFENKNAAQLLFEKETNKWKFKVICTIVAGIGSVCGFLIFNNYITNDLVSEMAAIIWLIGVIAAILSGSLINYFKVIWKFAKIGWFIIPFFILDILGFVFGGAIGLIIVVLLPVVPAIISLIQAKKNKKEAEKFIIYADMISNSSTN